MKTIMIVCLTLQFRTGCIPNKDRSVSKWTQTCPVYLASFNTCGSVISLLSHVTDNREVELVLNSHFRRHFSFRLDISGEFPSHFMKPSMN